jgi:AcrR family transcriptional regulator
VTVTPAPEWSAGRAPGRPRSATAEQAIVDATLALLVEGGVSGLSVEAVAARAGVGKATIYRRWTGKDSLIIDALARLDEDVPPQLRGLSVRDDLVTVLEHVRRKSTSTLAGQILPRMVAEARCNRELMACYREKVVAPRRARILHVLRAGVERGEVRADLDLELLVDLLVGPLIYRLLMRPDDRPLPRELPAAVVDAVLAGAGTGTRSG